MANLETCLLYIDFDLVSMSTVDTRPVKWLEITPGMSFYQRRPSPTCPPAVPDMVIHRMCVGMVTVLAFGTCPDIWHIGVTRQYVRQSTTGWPRPPFYWLTTHTISPVTITIQVNKVKCKERTKLAILL